MKSSESTKEAFAARIHKVLDEMQFSERGRAQRIKREAGFDISDRAINKWLNGESMPDHHNIEALAQYLDVNFNWLAAGQGEYQTQVSENNNVSAHAQSLLSSSSPSVIDLMNNLRELEKDNNLTPELVSLLNATVDTFKNINKSQEAQIDVGHLMRIAEGKKNE